MMKYTGWILISSLILTACRYELKPDKAITELKQLEGFWYDSSLRFYESWISLNDSSMSGKAFSLHHNDTAFIEFLSIKKRQDTVFYFAQVINQNSNRAIPFQLVEGSSDRWVFENKEHDYPNRIIYELEADTLLTTQTENIRGNKRKTFHFVKKSS